MPFMYWVILGGLAFAAALLVLFCLYFVKDCLCSRQSESFNQQEDDGLMTVRSYRDDGTPNTFNNRRRLLSSRPSAPALFALNEEEVDDGFGTEEIRSFQISILDVGRNTAYAPDSHLVVGVHGNPRVFGGYCVNLKEKTVEFYKIYTEDLPWRILNRSEGSEYEMKNLLFALMLWNEKITEVRKLHVYTNNNAINADNHRYGRRAAKLIEHYSGCCGVVVNESRNYVDRNEQPDLYATYILPAEDLTCGDFHSFQNFLLKYYDINPRNFIGTHQIPLQSGPRSQPGMKFETTAYYQDFTREVRGFMQACTSPCSKCGYVDDETASMTSINRIPR